MAVLPGLLFVLLWASGAIFTELGLRHSGPFPFLALRAGIALFLCGVIAAVLRESWPTGRRAWVRVAAIGLVMQGGYQACFFVALALGLSPGVLAVVLGMQPLVTAGWLDRRRAPWIGLTVGFLGLSLAVGGGDAGSIGGLPAVLVAFGALACITVGTLAQRRLGSAGSFAAISVQQGAALMLFLLVTSVGTSETVELSAGFVVSVLWMAVVVSTGATGLLVTMIRFGDATRVTALFYLVPPVTAVLDLLVFGRALNPVQWAGVALVVISLVQVQRGEVWTPYPKWCKDRLRRRAPGPLGRAASSVRRPRLGQPRELGPQEVPRDDLTERDA